MRERTQHFRPDIQGLRAIAVLGVLLFHAGLPLPGGFLGVDVFFVISGFVITAMLLREYQQHSRISLWRFYSRRFMRLIPALALVIVATLIVSAFVLSPLGPQQEAAITGLSAALSLGNIAIALTTGGYFDAPAKLNPLLHTWSLGVEEQFYVVFPIALIAALALGRRVRKTHVTAFALLSAATLLSFLIAVFRPVLPGVLSTTAFLGFYSPIPRLWEFGAGALVALWLAKREQPVTSLVTRIGPAVGLLMVVASMVMISSRDTLPGWPTLLPVVGTALVLATSSTLSEPVDQLLSTRPLRWVGDLSYSLYLWHWPFVSLSAVIWSNSPAVLIPATLLSVIPATVSYYFVEQRLRYRAWDTPRDAVLPLTRFVAVPASLGAVFWIVPSQVWGAELDQANAAPIGYLEGCHLEPSKSIPPVWCTWPSNSDSASAPPIYLVGDSNAAHFADGLVLTAAARNAEFRLSTARSCPFAPGAVFGDPEDESVAECETWQQAVFTELVDSTPGVVIVANSDSYWLGSDSAGLQAGLTLTAQELAEAGHDVMLVQTVPHWVAPYRWDLARCSLQEVIAGCDKTMPLSFSSERSAEVRDAVAGAADTSGAVVVDWGPVICPEGTCHAHGDTYWLYRDSNHISVPLSIDLAPEWSEILPVRSLINNRSYWE